MNNTEIGKWLFIGLCCGAGLMLALYGWPIVINRLPACGSECGSEDLLAQRDMASAAWWMVCLTAITLLVGAASLVFVAANLVEARKVTVEAARSATAAEKAVTEGREIGVAQTRAYLAVEAVTAHGARSIEIDFRVANAGQTPARDIQLYARMEIEDGREDDDADAVFSRLNLTTVADLASNATRVVSLTWTTTDLEESRVPEVLQAGAATLWVYGQISYRDIFTQHHMLVFRFAKSLTSEFGTYELDRMVIAWTEDYNP